MKVKRTSDVMGVKGAGAAVVLLAAAACVLESQGLTALGVFSRTEVHGDVMVSTDSGLRALRGVERIHPCGREMTLGLGCAGTLRLHHVAPLAEMVTELRGGDDEEAHTFDSTPRCGSRLEATENLRTLQEISGDLSFDDVELVKSDGFGKRSDSGEPLLVVGGSVELEELCGVESLAFLDSLRSFGGNLRVEETDLRTLDGLPGKPWMDTIHGDVEIHSNNSLRTMQGFPAVDRIRGDLVIRNNAAHQLWTPTPGFTVEGDVWLCDNRNLTPQEVDRWLARVQIQGTLHVGDTLESGDGPAYCHANGCSLVDGCWAWTGGSSGSSGSSSGASSGPPSSGGGDAGHPSSSSGAGSSGG
jgi:hypothetical protein